MVHSDNRAAAAIAMGIFASGAAVCALLIASHDQPFTWRNFRQTRCASASQAGALAQFALEVNPFLTISTLTERIVENITASLTH